MGIKVILVFTHPHEVPNEPVVKYKQQAYEQL